VTNLSTTLDELFSADGRVARLKDFEFRPQQRAMAGAIADALESSRHLIVEAPTGVGKSLAYLIPAVLFATSNKRKAIVSTHTKNLQEQLLRNDIEIVRRVLDVEFRAAVLKGRKNYLCTTRLQHALQQQRQLFETSENRELQRIERWVTETRTGDRETLPFKLETDIWSHVCSEQGICSQILCGPRCFFQRAKAHARDAQLVVMNHALFFTLFAQRQSDDFFIFPNDFVIFDEAHTLEQVAGTGIGKSISRAQVSFAIHRLFNARTKRGLFAKSRRQHLRTLCEETLLATNEFFDAISTMAQSLKSSSQTLRIRTPYCIANTMEYPLQSLQSAVKEVMEDDTVRLNKEELAGAHRLLWEAEILIREFLEQPESGWTYWVDLGSGRSRNVTLHTAPTDVAESVGPKLFRDNTSVIMTSATLAVHGSLGYFQNRLGARNARTLILDTPFEFRRQMRIAVARDISEPEHAGYRDELPGWIHRSVRRSGGKALVLFTNASVLRQVNAALKDRFAAEGMVLLAQDGSRQRHALLEEFRKDIRSVLFGLDSFWMGIDVPGEALEHVIITRLPFAVPDHPLIESRMEALAMKNGNSFLDYTLPEAVLKFRQGVGRLIRSRTDTGMVTILDSRILSRPYGRAFLQSIPRCPIEVLTSEGIVEELDASYE
jgi:ATP-dependent DNA helicase DinG